MREQSFKNANNSRPNDIRGGETKVMKKLLSSLIVLALLLSIVTPAFAAPASDVVGTQYEDAVAKLTALGVINGYNDGSYKPLNDITRAEFAKIIVVATGNESNAKFLAGTSAYTDVKGSEWYAGYVAAAQTLGLVKGYTDGTFRPTNNITTQEVVTVLLRALGYNDELPGNWPYDYLIKANDLGVIAGLDITAAAKANRGLVAQLTANTLEQKVVSFNSETKLFTEGAVFVASKLGKSFTDAVVTASALDANGKINLDWSAKAFAKDAYVGNWSVGEEVRYLVNSSNEIIYLTSAQEADLVVEGTLKTAVTEASNSLTLDDEDSTVIDFATITVMENNVPVVYQTTAFFKNTSDVTLELAYTIDAGSAVKVYLDGNGEVRFVVAEDFEAPVTAVKTTNATSYRDARLYYTNELTYVPVTADAKVFLNNEAASLSDITEGALVYYATNLDGKAVVVKAYDETLTGKVTSFRTATENTIYIDGVAFKTTLDASDVTVGDEYTVLFDKDGKVVSATSVTPAAAPTVVAVIKEVKDNVLVQNSDSTLSTVDKITVVTTKGEEVVYYTDGTYNGKTTTDAGDLGTITLDDNGRISNIVDIDTFTSATIKVDGIKGSNVTVVKADTSESTLVVNNDTVIFDVNDVTKPVKVSLADLKAGYDIRYTEDGYNFGYVLVDSNTGVSTELDSVTGLYVESFEVVTSATETTQYVVLNVEGTDVTYKFDGTVAGSIAVNDLVSLSDVAGLEAADGVFSGLTETTLKYAELTADATNNTFAANASFGATTGDVSYVVTANTVVYVVDADGNVIVGDIADLFALDRSDVAVDYVLTTTGASLGTYSEVASVVVYE